MEGKMDLAESYEKIKPAIVAFTPKFQPIYNPNESVPEFSPIFGTGFIIDDGIVVTNDHVVKEFPKFSKPSDYSSDLWPVDCLLLHYIPGQGVYTISIDVIGVMGISKMEHGKVYYGPPKPDVAFVHVKMKNLPHVKVEYNLKEIKEGKDIATAGFPMGTDTLTAPGYLHQLTPTLQKGIISAVLPFQCETPHALMINVMVQGGASGSPVFLPETGEVIGILNGGLEETRHTKTGLPYEIRKKIEKIEPSIHSHLLSAPTNISYVVPAHYIKNMIKEIKEQAKLEFPEDTLTLEEYLEQKEKIEVKRGDPHPLKMWEGEDAIKRTIKILNLNMENKK
jgi:S1-C subfamily serine protease